MDDRRDNNEKIKRRKWKIYLYFGDFGVGRSFSQIIDHLDQPLFYMTICHFQEKVIGQRRILLIWTLLDEQEKEIFFLIDIRTTENIRLVSLGVTAVMLSY